MPHTATAGAVPPSHTPTSIPTFTRTPTRTANPSATATSTLTPTGTPAWLPPGPECKPQPGRPTVKLAVPFMQQVVDLGGVDGNWACGPTSVAMVLAYYGKLQPWNEYLAQQQPTAAAIALKDRTSAGAPAPRIPPTRTPVYDAEYVPYITNAYSSYGHDYTRTAADPTGKRVAGLYGTICPSGLADWGMMRSVLQWHGLTANQIPATWEGVTAALKRGHPVILGNGLTPAGHIMVATGYAPHNQLIVNDPYGNRFSGGYGGTNGEGLFYPWSCSRVRVALEVIGVYPPPSPTATASPTATVTSTITVTPAVITTSAALLPGGTTAGMPQSPVANGLAAPAGRDDSREGSSRGAATEGNVIALSVAPPHPQAEVKSLVGKAPGVTGDQALRWAAVFFLTLVAMGSLLGRNGLVARRRRLASARARALPPEETTEGNN